VLEITRLLPVKDHRHRAKSKKQQRAKSKEQRAADLEESLPEHQWQPWRTK
jgi:hypothetical protein